MRSPLALTAVVLLLAACEVNVRSSRGANAPPPNRGVVSNGGTTAPPAYGGGGGGTTAPPAYGGGGGGGGGTTAPPATTVTPTTPPPANTGGGGSLGGGVVMPASGVGIPFGNGSVGAGGRMSPIMVIPAPAPSGPGTRGTDMATPLGRLPLVSGDVDFGTNVQYADSLKAMVYLLPPGTTSMPAFDSMRPQLAMYTRTFEVEPQNFRGLGTAGAGLRTKDFGIRYEGFVSVKVTGSYQITMANEDGARLYLDNKLVIDNDGVHPVTFKTTTLDLTAGMHLLRIDYFKAAANPEVALEVWVHAPGMTTNSVGMLGPSF